MLVWKFLHILGVVLMVGNVITTGFWAHWALSRREQALAIFASSAILKADLWLTITGGGLMIVPGIGLLHLLKLDVLKTPWLMNGIIALVVSTLVWLVFLLPDQFRMRRQAREGDMEALRQTYKRWSILGWGATAPLIYAIWVMVVK